jgi:hypothetical protein
MTIRLEGVESPHSTACLPNILDSILHATILPVHEISNFGERTFSIDYIYQLLWAPLKIAKFLEYNTKNVSQYKTTTQYNAVQRNAI